MGHKFWLRSRREGDCIVWTGPVDSRGYGHLHWNGKNARDHRVAYELAKGEIPVGVGHHGMVVMHTIAPDYGVSPAQVQRIRRGLQWKPNYTP